MNDEIAVYRRSSNEYRSTLKPGFTRSRPHCFSRAIIENHQTPVTLSLGEEIDQIERYVNQALFIRAAASKRTMLSKTCLQNLVNPVIRKTAKTFISQIKLSTSGLEHEVFTDSKWTDLSLASFGQFAEIPGLQLVHPGRDHCFRRL